MRKFLCASQKIQTLPKAPLRTQALNEKGWWTVISSICLERGPNWKYLLRFCCFFKKSTVETRKMYKTLGCCRSQFIHSLHVLGKFVSSQSFVQREEKKRQSRRKIGPFLDCLWGENILIHKKSSLDSRGLAQLLNEAGKRC